MNCIVDSVPHQVVFNGSFLEDRSSFVKLVSHCAVNGDADDHNKSVSHQLVNRVYVDFTHIGDAHKNGEEKKHDFGNHIGPIFVSKTELQFVVHEVH